MKIRVSFYGRPGFAIAKEENGLVCFNTWKERYGAGVGNVAHEAMHALGYKHRSNRASENQDSVPTWVGDLIEREAEAHGLLV